MAKRKTPKYSAFLSYSHSADHRLAPFIQKALHRLAKPWYKRRAIRVFRDETNLTANPDLWESIKAALRTSEYLLFLASPEAAASKWVRKELSFWCAEKDPQKLIILLADGHFWWNDDLDTVDWDTTTAVPRVEELERTIKAEPLWVDLKKFRGQRIDKRNAEFMDKIATIAARLHDLDKDEIYGEDIKQHKRTLWIAGLAAGGLVLLTMLAFLFAVFAEAGRRQAQYNLVSNHLALGDSALQSERFPEAAYWYWRAYDEAPAGDPRRPLTRRLVAGWSSNWIHFRHPSPVTALSVTSDGATLAVGGAGGSLHIWDVADGTRTSKLSIQTNPIEAMRFSHDGSQLAIVREGGRGRVRALDARKLTHPLYEFGPEIGQVAFALDDTILVGAKDNGETRNWSVKGSSNSVPVALAINKNPIRTSGAVDISADSRFVVSGTLLTAAIRDLKSGRVLGPFQHQEEKRGHNTLNDQLVLVRLDDTGERLATVGVEFIRIWDVSRRAILGEPFAHKGQRFDARFEPGGKYFTAVGWEGVRTWDLRTGSIDSTWLTTEVPIQALGIAAETGDVAAGSESGLVGFRHRTAKLGVQLHSAGHFVARIPGTQQLITSAASGKGLVRLDVEERSTTPLFADLKDETIFGVAVNPRGDLIAVRGFSDAQLWDVNQGIPRGPKLQHSTLVRDLSFSRDGKLLASIDADGNVSLWKIETSGVEELWKSPARPFGNGWSVEFSQDDKWIVASRDWELQVINAVNGQVKEAVRTGATIYDLAFSPDGSTFVAGGFNNQATFWDIDTMQSVGLPLSHEGSVTAVAFSSDGSLVTTASTDGTTRLWDTLTHRPVAPAWQHGHRVDSAIFGPGDQTVITGSVQEPLTAWNIPAPSVVDRQHLELSVEVRSGYRRDEAGRRQPLSYEDWEQRRKQLAERYKGFGDFIDSRSSSRSLVDGIELPPNRWDRLWVWLMGWD